MASRLCAFSSSSRALALLLGLLLGLGSARAGCTDGGAAGGPLHLDRCDENEAKGIFARKQQKRLDLLVLGGTLGLAPWQGSEAPAGRDAWMALDAMATTALATEVMKNVFQRPRPNQDADPDLWRQGRGHKSFPSGETAMMAAFVTPLILRHAQDTPAIWALAALPVYMGAARVRSQGHWTSDVLAGGAVGVVGGLWAAERNSPLILAPLPGGAFVGFRQRW